MSRMSRTRKNIKRLKSDLAIENVMLNYLIYRRSKLKKVSVPVDRKSIKNEILARYDGEILSAGERVELLRADIDGMEYSLRKRGKTRKIRPRILISDVGEN